MRYIKKPVVVEAWQFNGESVLDRPKWFKDFYFLIDEGNVYIPTLEGIMKASPGDYIIKGVKGEIYPVKPDIFEATYEKVDEGL